MAPPKPNSVSFSSNVRRSLISGALVGMLLLFWSTSIVTILARSAKDHDELESLIVQTCDSVPGEGCQEPDRNPDATNNEIVGAVSQLTAGVNNLSEGLKDVTSAFELAEIRTRLARIEQSASPHAEERCSGKPTHPQHPDSDCDDHARFVPPGSFTSCVHNELVGRIQFTSNTESIAENQHAKLSEMANNIRGTLKYVYAVGFGDDCERSSPGVALAQRRAQNTALALQQQLNPAMGEQNSDPYLWPRIKVRAVAARDWVFPESCRSGPNGSVDVFLLWQGPWPLCRLTQPVSTYH